MQSGHLAKKVFYYLFVHAVQLRSAQKDRGKSNFFEISYEQLINDTFNEIDNFGKKIGITFDNYKIDNYSKFSLVKVFPDEVQWKKNVHALEF